MPKEAAIRSGFGMSGARYDFLLNRLMDPPEALQHDPLTIRRHRRERVDRRKQFIHGGLGR